jgi:hypothetical protein
LGDSGVTPRALVCGWFAITPLMSSLAAVNEIPADLPHEEFNRALVRDVQEISKVFDEWEAEEHERMEAWYNEEKRAAPKVNVGDLVLLAKGNPEKLTGGKLMPRADGPYEVKQMPNSHTVVLVDPESGKLILEGRPQTTARCILFRFPKHLLVPLRGRDEEGDSEYKLTMSDEDISVLQIGDLVSYIVDDDGDEHVGLLLIEGLHLAQHQVTGRELEAPGPGAWSQRTWAITLENGVPKRGMVPYAKVLAKVELENNRLTGGSLETLRARGVAV